MSDGFEPVSTTVEGWKAAALKWKAEADALRAENERLARSAHAFLGASKRRLAAEHEKTLALEKQLAGLRTESATFPKCAADVRPEWLAELLQKDVQSMSLVRVLEAGVTSDAALFALEYGAGEQGPASLCLKYAKATEANRVFAMRGSMYEKELFFQRNLQSDVAKAIRIPHVFGVFDDPLISEGKEFFCIAMEDLTLEHDAIDQVKGISLDECNKLGLVAAKFHADFWEKQSILEQPCVGGGEVIFFEPWARNTLADWSFFEKYEKTCKDYTDMTPTPRDKRAHEIMRVHGGAIFDAFETALRARPRTLTHGDMRADNIFRRKDGAGFAVIDWQTYGAGPPAVEMHQLFTNGLKDLAMYAHLPDILRGYIDELHRLCPAAREYTYEMLYEDTRMCCVFGHMAMANAIGPILASLDKDHPNVTLLGEFVKRIRASYSVLDIAGCVIDQAEKMGLSV